MPYLALDLDAKRKCAMIGRAIGLSPGEVCWGLLELWEFAWREKRAQVTGIELRACVGSNGELTAALEQFGFIEANETGWRVRGAEAWLKLAAAQSEAGKTVGASNLKAYNERRKLVTASADTPPSTSSPSSSPTSSTSSSPTSSELALSPSTQHPAPEKKTSAVDKPQRQPSTAESLFAWWQDRRGEAGLTTEAKPNIARLNSTLKPKLEHHGRPELELRYRAYLSEPKYKPLNPPWAWQMFLAVVEQLKPKAASTAVRIVRAGDLYADME